MKTILKFTLPEERDELNLALRGMDYFAALWDIKKELRNHKKYGISEKEFVDRVEGILLDIYFDDIS